MKNSRPILLLALLLLGTYASASQPTLPVVSMQDFLVGRKWTWDYRQADGTLYSSETYEVLENDKGRLRIAMSTKFPDRTEIVQHHRIDADVTRCLDAYRSPVTRKGWSIRLMFWDKDHWADSGATQTLAFEEKFNCNPHAGASSEQYAAQFKSGENGEIFLIQRKSKVAASWYNKNGRDRAIQAEKEFVEGGKLLFHSKLRAPAEEPELLF